MRRTSLAVRRGPLGAVLVGVVLLAGCGDGVPVVELEAQPSPTSSPEPTPSDTATTSPSPSETATESPSPTETEPRDPTDTDRARFVAAHDPAGAGSLQHVAADVDGDDVEEIVFAYIRSERVAHVDVAWWTGTSYEVVFTADGGAGTTLDRLRAADVNADGRTELVTAQSTADSSSLTLWQVTGPSAVRALVAAGGCHDGSNTYGATGATLEDRDADGAAEVYATCPDGSTARYRWEADRYREAPTLVP